MRVIAGTARRLQLKTLEGLEVRPTTDRIKETLFNIINNRLHECRFLDIFAGSGGIGIEALSRGASAVVFIEQNKAAIDCIEKNLSTTRLSDNASIMAGDAVYAVRRLDSEKKQFDIIFMDPPYNKLLEKSVLMELMDCRLLTEDGMIITEASADTDFSYLEGTCFTVTREKCYGSNKHVFIEWSKKE